MKIDKSVIEDEGKKILFARLASVLQEGGDIEEAVRICQKGLKKFPTYAQAHFVLAKCYLKKEMIDEARSEFERVLRYDPNHLNTIKELMKIFKQIGLDDIYKEYLLKLFTLDPLNNEVTEEVKSIGMYKSWRASDAEPVQEESLAPTEEQEDISQWKFDDEFEAGKEEENALSAEPESIDDDRLDLSQFDNREDDFTTIMDGIFKPNAQKDYEEHSTDFNLPSESEEEDTPAFVSDINKTNRDENELFSDIGLEEDLPDSKNTILEEPQVSDDLDFNSPSIDQPASTPELDIDEDDNKASDLSFDAGAEEQKTNEFFQESIKKGDQAQDTDIEPQESFLSEEKPIGNLRTDKIEYSAGSDEEIDDEEPKFQKPKIISQTLGEILVSQKKYKEAKEIFEALKEKQPNNLMLDKKIALIDQIIALGDKQS